MSTKKIRQKPIFYITQPITQFPYIIMQEKFTTKRNEAPLLGPEEKAAEFDSLIIELGATPHALESPEVIGQQNNDIENSNNSTTLENPNPAVPDKIQAGEAIDGKAEMIEQPLGTKKRYGNFLQKVKNFKEMDIDEKLVYLEHLPKQISPISCLYTTAETTYMGILVKNQEQKIEIKLRNDAYATISKIDLQEIRLLGFH